MNLTIIALLMILICQMLCGLDAQQCRGEYSIGGMMLKQHTFKELKALNGLECSQMCDDDVKCQSFNYVISQYMCELNNRTKEARPEDYVPDSDRFYVKRLNGRVPLGSISELPAESCAEIGASEGQNAVSGKYWFDSIKPGQVIQAPCNMSTKDTDECNSSVPVCDVNANCHNTVGSFICVCKAGFSGDGYTCADIDECVSGEYDCHRFASCKNTVGSYSCSCVPHFTGDGKACTQTAPECTNYQTLTSSDRKTTAGGGGGCDSSLGPGWFRFLGDAGTKMPISCVPSSRCGTHAPGWLNGAHPTVTEGKVTRQVCFSWTVCCQWAINVYVRNCSDFLVYYINQTPPEHMCHLRYCGTD